MVYLVCLKIFDAFLLAAGGVIFSSVLVIKESLAELSLFTSVSVYTYIDIIIYQTIVL